MVLSSNFSEAWTKLSVDRWAMTCLSYGRHLMGPSSLVVRIQTSLIVILVLVSPRITAVIRCLSLAVNTVGFCIVLSHVLSSKTSFPVTDLHCDAAYGKQILPLTSLSCYLFHHWGFWVENQRRCRERERTITLYSCLSFYIFVYFIVMKGVLVELKYSLIVIKRDIMNNNELCRQHWDS